MKCTREEEKANPSVKKRCRDDKRSSFDQQTSKKKMLSFSKQCEFFGIFNAWFL